MMYFFGKFCLFGAKILVRLCFLKSGYPNLLIVDDADINPDEHILHLKRYVFDVVFSPLHAVQGDRIFLWDFLA